MPSINELHRGKQCNKKRKNRPDPDEAEANTINDEVGGPQLEKVVVDGNGDRSPKESREEQDVHAESDGDEVVEGSEGTIAATKIKNKKSHGILTTDSFSNLPISKQTMKAIQEMGFQHMTQVSSHFIDHFQY